MAKDLLKPITVLSAKCGDEDYRLTDGGGLYLLVKTNGASGGALITASKASAKLYR
jgi:hypothetical protein